MHKVVETSIKRILETAKNSDVSWLRPETIAAVAQDMRNANSDTAMDRDFDDMCALVIVEMTRQRG